MDERKFDVIVAGGGFAGVAAALSAAREGLNVLLFDKNNCFGGAAVGCLVNPFMPYWTIDPKDGKKQYLSGGIFAEIVANLKGMNAMPDDMMFHEEYLKLLLNRMLTEAGVTILFHAYLVSAEVSGNDVKNVTVACKSECLTFSADVFIDATGDGDLAFLCGCPYQLGRESDNLCQPMTLCFRAANVDMEKFHEEYKEIQRMYDEYRRSGKIKNIREDVLTFKVPVEGIVHFNSTRIVKKNPVDPFDVTNAEIEAREQVFELFEFLKNNFEAFRNSELIITASEIGVRESRMIEGEYILNVDDLKSCRRFDDSIAVGNYDIDIHNPEGSGTSHYFFKAGEYYTIPYRCLTPKVINNILVAGRCISATHEAQASVRIMPICCCTGQAAGLAAAVAKKSESDVKSIDVGVLRKKLKENGAVI